MDWKKKWRFKEIFVAFCQVLFVPLFNRMGSRRRILQQQPQHQQLQVCEGMRRSERWRKEEGGRRKEEGGRRRRTKRRTKAGLQSDYRREVRHLGPCLCSRPPIDPKGNDQRSKTYSDSEKKKNPLSDSHLQLFFDILWDCTIISQRL